MTEVTPQKVSSSKPKSTKNICCGSNQAVKEVHDGFVTIFKSQSGERKNMRSTIRESVSYHHREILASELNDFFGFNLVPLTVEAKSKGEIGSRQVWVRGNISHYFEKGYIRPALKRQIVRMIFFDMVCGNTDRHAHNWIYDEDANKLWAIDNGLCFPYRSTREVRIEISTKDMSYTDIYYGARSQEYSKFRIHLFKMLSLRERTRLRSLDKEKFLDLFRAHGLEVEGRSAWLRMRKLLTPLKKHEKAA